MFASLLPGLRDARTPVAVGMILLGCLWVWFSGLVPTAESAQGLWKQVYRLSAGFGAPFLVTVTLFLAYLLGMMFSWLHLDWPVIRRRLPPGLNALSGRSVDLYSSELNYVLMRVQNSKQAYEEVLRSAVLHPIDYEMPGKHGPLDSDAYPIDAEVRVMAMGLQASHPQVFDSYDRLSAEAEFRRAIAAPLAALVISILLQMFGASGWVLLCASLIGIVLIVSLHVLSFLKSRAANDHIMAAMAGSYTESPSFKQLLDLAGSYEQRLQLAQQSSVAIVD